MTSPIPPSHTPTPRSRQLSGIEEEEEKNKLSHKDHEPSSSSTTREKSENKGGDLEGEKGEKVSLSHNKSEAKPVRPSLRRRKSVDVDNGMKRVKSRDSLEPVSQSRPESPPIVSPRRDFSKYSPRTERKKIINKLRKLSVDESATTADDGGERPTQSQLSTSLLTQREAEDDLESSLDLYKRDSVEDDLPEIQEQPLHIHSPLEDIKQAMEADR